MSLNSFRSGMGTVTSTPVGKGVLFTVGAMLVFSLVYSGLGNNLGGRSVGAGAAAAPDEAVATVNGLPITRAEYEQASSQAARRGLGGQGVGQAAFLHAGVLDQLTTEKLALAQAQKMGVTASDSEVASARQAAAQQNGLPGKLGLPATASVADMDAALVKVGSPNTVEQLPTFTDEYLRNGLILQKLTARFAPVVTEQDARDFYKEYHTQHILVDNKKVSDVQAQSKAGQILAKLKAPGADFGALAKQYSDDPGTKAKGGDDGWIGEDTPDPATGQPFKGYITEFVKAATALKPGEVTPSPVKTPQFGYFLIKLDGVRQNLPKDFEKNKAQYIAQVRQQRQGAATQAFVAGLKGDPSNKITVLDAELRGDQALAQAAQGDPNQRLPKLQAAVTAYNAALKNAPSSAVGAINASLAQAYQGLGQTPQAIAATKAAVDATHDQQLELTLGQLYAQNKDPQDAIAQYQAVSTQAWDDPQVHQQLAASYAGLKRPDLAAKEAAQAKAIQKRQAANPPPGGLPGGMSGLPPGFKLPPGATVLPASGQPAAPASKPGQ